MLHAAREHRFTEKGRSCPVLPAGLPLPLGRRCPNSYQRSSHNTVTPPVRCPLSPPAPMPLEPWQRCPVAAPGFAAPLHSSPGATDQGAGTKLLCCLVGSGHGGGSAHPQSSVGAPALVLAAAHPHRQVQRPLSPRSPRLGAERCSRARHPSAGASVTASAPHVPSTLSTPALHSFKLR